MTPEGTWIGVHVEKKFRRVKDFAMNVKRNGKSLIGEVVMQMTLTIRVNEEHGWTPEQVVDYIEEAEGLTVTPLILNLDEAARFMQQQMNDAVWERMPEHFKERYRDKIRHILILCGATFVGGQ